MVGTDAFQVLVTGVRAHSVEERADLPGPAFEVTAQHQHLVVPVGKFGCGEPLPAPADSQLTLACGAQVAHPLRRSARRHEVTRAVDGEQVHRHRPWQPGRPSADGEDARSVDRDAQPGESGDRPVEDVSGEPARLDVSLGAGHRSTATYLVARYSSMPSRPPSRPNPDCLTPPNSAAGLLTRPRLSPTIPTSSASTTRIARLMSLVKT